MLMHPATLCTDIKQKNAGSSRRLSGQPRAFGDLRTKITNNGWAAQEAAPACGRCPSFIGAVNMRTYGRHAMRYSSSP